MKYTYHDVDGKDILNDRLFVKQHNAIFVFGSNELGIHKRGSALEALNNYGAILGEGWGLIGRSFAIPTKNTPWKSLSLEGIKQYVNNFQWFTRLAYPNYTFIVTRIGCGLAGYTDEDIAPLFKDSPTNCWFHYEWEKYLEQTL